MLLAFYVLFFFINFRLVHTIADCCEKTNLCIKYSGKKMDTNICDLVFVQLLIVLIFFFMELLVVIWVAIWVIVLNKNKNCLMFAGKMRKLECLLVFEEWFFYLFREKRKGLLQEYLNGIDYYVIGGRYDRKMVTQVLGEIYFIFIFIFFLSTKLDVVK